MATWRVNSDDIFSYSLPHNGRALGQTDGSTSRLMEKASHSACQLLQVIFRFFIYGVFTVFIVVQLRRPSILTVALT